MNSFPVLTLKENTFFTQELGLDKQFLLLNPTCPFTESLKKALLEWDFKVVYSEGSTGSSTYQPSSTNSFEQVTIDDVGIEETPVEKKPEFGSSVKKVLEEAHADLSSNEVKRMDVVQNVYNEYMNYITAVYTHYATHTVLDYQDLSDTVKELCVFIKESRRFVLRVTPVLEGNSKNFIVSHSMRSTVTAIVIGLQMRMPLPKLIELGITCLLHEIGQIRLPPQLYMTDRRLSPPERQKLATHSVLGYEIVKKNEFPLSVQIGVLEHHEREDGTGYPQKKKGDKISLYAKIIAVACTFEAITAPRHFKEARSTYEGMIEILKGNGKQFDENVTKALLYSISLYPIGAYVYLSNGKIAQVTDVNPNDPKNPILQIFGETLPDGSPKTVQSDSLSNKIVRVLNKAEAADILKQFNK